MFLLTTKLQLWVDRVLEASSDRVLEASSDRERSTRTMYE